MLSPLTLTTTCTASGQGRDFHPHFTDGEPEPQRSEVPSQVHTASGSGVQDLGLHRQAGIQS